jgi:hypothetical protein
MSGLAPSLSSSPYRGYSGTMRETTRPGLAPKEHLSLLAVIERYIYPCWLSPANGNPDSTQFLTGTTVPVFDR